MPQGSPAYVPAPEDVADGASVDFVGTDSSSDAAIITSVYGSFDMHIYRIAHDGTDWVEVSQLTDDEGNATFEADVDSQFNRILVEESERGLRIYNVDSASGTVAVDGYETVASA